MAQFKNYNPGKVILSVGGVQISGFKDGTFIKVSRETKTFADKAGAGGDVVRTRSLDKRGSFVFTLQDASPSNDFLSQRIRNDELKGNQVGATQLADGNGTTIINGANTWVEAPCDVEYADESGGREWTVRVAELEMFVGGFVS